MIISLAAILFFFNLPSLRWDRNGPINDNKSGYEFTTPDETHVLPDILKEISGLTVIDSNTVACVQDENGILFIYDLSKNAVKQQYVFNGDGDYEGITRVDKTIYILRSDGTLFEISDYDSKTPKPTSHTAGIPLNNYEGLCYDPDNNRLLIACKGKIGKGSAFKDRRVIYGFDLKTKTFTQKPVFNIDLKSIKQFAVHAKINLPTKVKKHGQHTEPIIKFRASAICIHPLEKKLFLLAASDYLLFIFNKNGTIEHIEQLDPLLCNKAEGITFLQNGDLFISNEGEDKKPTIVRFNYKEK